MLPSRGGPTPQPLELPPLVEDLSLFALETENGCHFTLDVGSFTPPTFQSTYTMFGSRGRSSSYASITDALPLQRQTVESEVESDPQRKEQLKKLFELMDHHLASGACCVSHPPAALAECRPNL